jgi:hypothetical protein
VRLLGGERNRRESTRTGRKKRGRQAIQRSPSSEMPPPGTIMWACGWWVRCGGRRGRRCGRRLVPGVLIVCATALHHALKNPNLLRHWSPLGRSVARRAFHSRKLCTRM